MNWVPAAISVRAIGFQAPQSPAVPAVRLEFLGGGTHDDASRAIPEKRDGYPEFQMFGKLSAFGLFLRHARNLRLRDIELVTEKPDARPPVVATDVEGLDINGRPAVRQQLN